MQVERNSVVTDSVELTIASLIPGIFQYGTTNRAVVLNQDQTINSAANPAKRGSVITFWATGLGLMEPSVSDGSVASSHELSRAKTPVIVSFFGWPADVLYAGSAPGFVAGTVQINARVPKQMGPFDYPVDLVLSSNATYAPGRVTVNVR